MSFLSKWSGRVSVLAVIRGPGGGGAGSQSTRGLGERAEVRELILESGEAELEVVEPLGPGVKAVGLRDVWLAQHQDRVPLQILGGRVVRLCRSRLRGRLGLRRRSVRELEARREEALASARVAVDVSREGGVAAANPAPRFVVGLLDESCDDGVQR